MTDLELIKAREDAMFALGRIAQKNATPQQLMLAVDAIIAAAIATLTLYYGDPNDNNGNNTTQ